MIHSFHLTYPSIWILQLNKYFYFNLYFSTKVTVKDPRNSQAPRTCSRFFIRRLPCVSKLTVTSWTEKIATSANFFLAPNYPRLMYGSIGGARNVRVFARSRNCSGKIARAGTIKCAPTQRVRLMYTRSKSPTRGENRHPSMRTMISFTYNTPAAPVASIVESRLKCTYNRLTAKVSV